MCPFFRDMDSVSLNKMGGFVSQIVFSYDDFFKCSKLSQSPYFRTLNVIERFLLLSDQKQSLYKCF